MNIAQIMNFTLLKQSYLTLLSDLTLMRPQGAPARSSQVEARAGLRGSAAEQQRWLR